MFQKRLVIVSGLLLLLASAAMSQHDIRDVSAREAVAMVRYNSGRVVMLHLYASWCAPCRRELPDVNRIGAEYAPRGLVLIAASIDEDVPALRGFLGSAELSFAPLRIASGQPGDIAAAIATIGGTYKNAIPYTAIVGKNGRLAYEWSGGVTYRDYTSILTPLVEEAGPAPTAKSERGTAAVPGALAFSITAPAGLRVAQAKSNLVVLTPTGTLNEKPSDDPLYIAGSAYAKTAITDRKQFALERLRATGSLTAIAVRETKEIRVNDLPCLEIVAEGTDTDINKTVLVYQAMVFADNRYYVVQGFGRPAERDRLLGMFRTATASFRRQ
jgi:thiol-disulfide isomerase/thioredoxin